ncbi:MAG TPA: sugar phosphate nucleotidyltransferase [Thermoanaerobaculia bacterium]|nr:sugar phosphate nucleotidyltransferase [Thermoanaerobaculia bacterium]
MKSDPGSPTSSPSSFQALILAGGTGTRFWPLSRKSRPKQLLALEGDTTLLRATFERLQPLVPPGAVWVCTTANLAEAVRRELPEVPPEQILLEPEGRNTAPAIGWSVRSMPEEARRGPVAVLPADHRVGDPEAFREILGRAARRAAEEDRVMTLGVTPRWAETGYGYLELDEDAEPDGLRRVRRFVEKPDAENAARFLAAGNYLWNAGIFVFRGTTFLSLLERHEPELARGLEEIALSAASADTPGRIAELYGRLPANSIDYAVMEKLDAISTFPLDCGWSDLGSWEALYEVLPAAADGNAHRGDTLAVDSRGNLLFSDAGTVAVVGVRDLVVVRTGDTVLVCPRERSQDVRKLVAQLTDRGRGELL